METIRIYLENMFMQLPKTNEVMRAKMELGQMMEDKYNELIAEGKTDNEATGIIISEFGNLDELAEGLGIHDYVKNGGYAPKKAVSLDTVKTFISEKIASSVHIAIAVLLCITSPVAVIITSALAEGERLEWNVADAIGVLMLFVLIAVAVGLIVYDSIRMSKWNYLKKEAMRLDFSTESYVKEQLENYRPTYALYITLGVVLCIVSVVPSAVICSFSYFPLFMEEISGAFVLIFVGVGVMFFIMGCMRKGCYESLLSLNGAETGENRGDGEKSELEKNIISVFWPTVTCIYLIWSFLSMDWYITWIIWPVAAVVERIIKLICRSGRK